MENSITKRLSLQNEILNWLKEFSEKLQSRANAVTLEVHELVDQTGIVEQDMKNTLNSFRSLLYHQSTYNRISGEETSGEMEEDTENLGTAGIPAQSYENDILPRYKEAISLGLSSYRNHIQKRNLTSSVGSSFVTGLVHDPLPHIIGSEEYVHDNRCGLTDTEDLILERESLNFSNITEPKGILYSDGGSLGSDTLLSGDLFGGEQEPFWKEGNEPLVSAALDFKAMLEAALLSPYKFYDKESTSLSSAVDGNVSNTEQIRAELDSAASMASDTVEVASSENTAGIIDAVPPITAGNSISIQESDIQSHNLASALISGSLFDVDEESFPSSVQEIHEIFPTKDVDTHQGVNEIETGPSPPLVADDAAANNIASQNEPLPDNQTSTTSLPPLDDADDVIEASELHSRSAGLSFHAPNERDSVDASSETSTYGGVEGHCQISNDLLMLCEDRHERRISSGQTVGGSLPLPSKEIFDGSDCDDDCDDHEEDLSVISEDAVVSQSHLASHNVTGDGEPHTSSSHHSGS